MTRNKHRPAVDRKATEHAAHPKPAIEPGEGHKLPPLTRSTAVAGILLIFGSVLLAYIPAMRAGYVRFDDTDYIQENQLLRTAHGLQVIWTHPQAYPPGVPYYPVTFTLHWVEFHLWGSKPIGYHVANVALHALNASLVWLLLRRLQVPGAILAALLFAVHPVQVQSVAWLAESKNVLSMLFYLLTALAWLRFARTGSRPVYAAVTFFFVLGLLSKTSVCTLPIALLLWIWWRRPTRAGKYVLSVVPLLGLAILAVALVTWRENTLLEGKSFASGFSLVERLLIAARGIWFYIGKVLLPINLFPIYPHWTVDSHRVMPYVFVLAVAAAVSAGWLLREKIGRAPLAAILFFVVGLAPTSGLVDFGYLAKSFVGDHYLYLPSLGVLAGLAALAAKLTSSPAWLNRYGAPVVAGIVIWSLGALTWRQCGIYREAVTFWQDVVAHNPTPTALSSLGDAYLTQKDLNRAEDLLRTALTQRDSVPTRFRLACVLIERGQFSAAAEQIQRGLELNQTRDRLRGMNTRLLFNLGYCYYHNGDYDKAADSFRQAAELDPSFAAARTWQVTAEDALRRRHETTTATRQSP
jgi:tetratricopeptide (TPR) repeat protein